MISLSLSATQRKAADRLGGADFILRWPPGLADPALAGYALGDERDATRDELGAATTLIGEAAAAAGLAIVWVSTALLEPTPSLPPPHGPQPCLVVRIIGRRWLSAHRAHNAGPRRECWIADASAPLPPRPDGGGRGREDDPGLDIPAICRQLDEARQHLGWTKRDLARASGVSEQQVAKLLDPARFGRPQLATALRVAEALGLTLDGLLGLPAGYAMVPPGEDPIAYILAARGWTMQQLGREAGLSHGTVPAIVAGKSRPDLLTAHAIARAGGVSLDSLARTFLG